jgi:tetratricopeptide (TPR) repeat protein
MTVRDLLEGRRIASETTADAVEQPSRSIRLWQRAFIVGIIGALIIVSALVVLPSLASLFFLQRGTQSLMQAQQPADLDAAIQNLERAISLRQDDTNAYVQLAQVAFLQGHADRAVSLLEQAYRLQPSSLFIQRELAIAYEHSAQLERSSAVWANLGIQPPTMVALGDGYFERREYEQAAQWYSRSLLYQPDLAEGLAFRQAAIAALTQHATAGRLLANLSQKDPNLVAIPA